MDWYGPSVTDLGAISTVAYSAGPTGTDQAVLDFRIEGNGEVGALTFLGHDGSAWRALGRTYDPYSLGGDGWAAAGSSFQYIDNGGGFDLSHLALSMNASGDVFSVFGDGATASNTLNSGFASGDTWGADTPSIGSTVPTAPISGDLAWDDTGNAYYAYVDASGSTPTGVPSLIAYTSFSAWDAAASIVTLASAATQVGVRYDGYYTQVVWRGDRPMYGLRGFSGGPDFACAVTAAGAAMCWGENGGSQLGIGVMGADENYPQTVLASGVTAVSAGTAHACAIYLTGAFCWGDNTNNQLSSGAGNPQLTPAAVTNLSADITSIAAGGDFSCAIDTSGDLSCWGEGSLGQLGDGTSTDSAVPLTTTASYSTVVAGSHFACALSTSGAVDCWGEGTSGQIGNGASMSVAAPTNAIASGATALVAGSNHACALKSDSTVVCWGDNSAGQVGDTTLVTPVNAPSTVLSSATGNPSLKGVTRLSASGNTTCAVTRAQVLYCWGSNANGQILGAAAATQSSALAITGLQGAPAYPRVGGTFACASLTNGMTECWGDNASGQLGIGNVTTPITEPKLLNEECSNGSGKCAILASSNRDSYASVTPLSSLLADDAFNFSMATDTSGNTLVTFIQKNPAASACDTSTTPITRKCAYRVFSTFHSIGDTWTGPTQLDDPTLFASTSTTLFQDTGAVESTVAADDAGGITYPTPQVAYLGSDIFLAAFPMTDTSAGTSGLYSRTFTVGAGWDRTTTTVESTAIDTDSAEAYRVVNDLHLATDQDGNAMLSTQVVLDADDNSDATLRSYGFRFHPYQQGAWKTAETTDDAYACAGPSALPVVGTYFCWGLKARGAVFYGGESTVVFEAPDVDDSTKLRLYEMEYR